MTQIGNPRNRVLQLDGYLLEEQVESILEQQIKDVFSDTSLPLRIQRIGSRYGEDVGFLLKLLMFKLFVWDKSSTYGLMLQNLKLSNSSSTGKNALTRLGKLVLLGAVVARHVGSRIASFTYSADFEALHETHPKIYALLQKMIRISPFLDRGYAITEFVNTLAFYTYGSYVTVLHRVFGITHERINESGVSFASNPETISYEFQDRQLIWNGITEFLGNIKDVKLPRGVARIWHRAVHRVTSSMDSQSLSPGAEATAMFKFLPERCCAICYKQDPSVDKNVDDNLITNAYVTDCGHVYCYLCVMNEMYKATNSEDYNVDDDSGGSHWTCLRCNEKVYAVSIYQAGIHDELRENVTAALAVSQVDADDDGSSDSDTSSEYEEESDGDDINRNTKNEIAIAGFRATDAKRSHREDDTDVSSGSDDGNSDSESSAYEYDEEPI